MKHFYYFSKSKLKFVEIRNFRKKFLFLIMFFSIFFSFLIFSGYIIINEIINPNSQVADLKNENREMSAKFEELLSRYDDLNEGMSDLLQKSDDLRLQVNLPPLSNENIGTGGSYFEQITPSNSRDVSDLISRLDKVVENISVKVKLEENNYNEIENAFNYNEKLFDAIPAIIPCKGTFGSPFGMRLHPVLKIRRMHNGQDIICNTGTKVYASGGGKVEYTGWRGGLGYTVIIDHGFGYRTYYGHLSKILTKKGEKIKRGDLIALSGATGKLSTGQHLHYEVRHNGIALNPLNFMYDDVDLFEIVSNK